MNALLKPREMIPSFTLRATDGTAHRTSTYRGRRSLVLIFPGRDGHEFIQGLEARKAELEEEDAQVLVITSSNVQASIFPVLTDADNQMRNRFGVGDEAVVFITDPYGEIYSAFEGSEIPATDEVLASLRHINAACPE